MGSSPIVEEMLKKCTCPVCRCRCRKAYKKGNLQDIMAELAKYEVNNVNSLSTDKEKQKEEDETRAIDFISKSIAYGYERRNSYNAVMK